MSERYDLIILQQVYTDLDDHARAGAKGLVKKIHSFFPELQEHPRTGTGKPEQLRHMDGEFWSRKIDSKHRLVYEIVEDQLIVTALSASGHYDDK